MSDLHYVSQFSSDIPTMVKLINEAGELYFDSIYIRDCAPFRPGDERYIIKHAEQEGKSLKVTVLEDGFYQTTKVLQIFEPKEFALANGPGWRAFVVKQASKVQWAEFTSERKPAGDPHLVIRF